MPLRRFGWMSALALLAALVALTFRPPSPARAVRPAYDPARTSSANSSAVGFTRTEHRPEAGVPFGNEFWRPAPASPSSSTAAPSVSPNRLRDALERVAHALQTDADSDHLHLQAQAYTAQWDTQGWRFRSARSSTEFQFRTTSLQTGTASKPAPTQFTWQVAGNTAQRLIHADLGWIEHHEARAAGLEVTWVLPSRPPSGDVQIEVEITGGTAAGTTARGCHWADATGVATVCVYQPVAIDSAGNRWSLALSPTDSGFAVEIPATVLAEAHYPLAIDPLISPEFGLDQPVEGPSPSTRAAPSVAANAEVTLVVWMQGKGETAEPSVFAARLNAAGQLLDPQGILLATSVGEQSTTAVAANPGEFLAVWSTPHGSSTVDWDVVGMRVKNDGSVVDAAPLAIGALAGSVQNSPAAAGNGENYLVAWRDNRSTGIYGSLITPVGPQAPVGGFAICTAANDQYLPAVAALGTNFLVVWQDYRPSTANSYTSDIYGERISGSGTLLGTNIPICVRTNAQYHPAVAANGTNYLVVWEDYDLQGYDLRGTRVSPDGLVLDTNALVIAHAPNLQANPAVGAQNGEFLVAWEDYRHSTGSPFASDIYAARVRDDGTVTDAEGLRLTSAPGIQGSPAVAGRDGIYQLAWQDARNNPTTTLADIYGTRLLAGSDPIPTSGPEFMVSGAVNGEIVPAVASSGTNLLAVWADNRNTLTNGLDIVGARLDFHGALLDTQAIPICVVPGRQTDPAVAWDGSNYLVAWTDYRNTPANAFHGDIFGTLVSADGLVVSPHGTALCTATNDQVLPAIAALTGEFLVVWQDARASTVSTVRQDIYGTRVSPAGAVLDPTGIAVCTNSALQTTPAIAGAGTQALVVWTDARNGTSTDIYGTRVQADGAILDTNNLAIARVTNVQMAPSVAASGSEYLVAWTDLRAGSLNPDIFATWVGLDGQINPTNGFAVRSATGQQAAPAVTFNGADYFVAWQEARSALSNSFDIFGARVRPGSQQPAEPMFLLDTASNNQLWPAAAAGCVGQVVIVSQGFRSSAARTVATVVDLEAQPTVSSLLVQPDRVALTFRAAVGQRYRVETSQDLQTWTELNTLTCTNTPVEILDAAAASQTHRYYRVLLLP